MLARDTRANQVEENLSLSIVADAGKSNELTNSDYSRFRSVSSEALNVPLGAAASSAVAKPVSPQSRHLMRSLIEAVLLQSKFDIGKVSVDKLIKLFNTD